MIDWYTEALTGMWRNKCGWVAAYAAYSGHFVDDFGNMVRVYAPDEDGVHHFM